MRIGFRSRLFLVSFSLIVIALVLTGLLLQRSLRTWLGERVENELLAQAHLVRGLVEEDSGPISFDTADRMTDVAAGATGSRITIIREDGVVLGDSDLDPRQTRVVENHGQRPEVLQAAQDGIGMARRYSTTVRVTMLYVAVPYARTDGNGFARIALPLLEERLIVARFRRAVLAAGLFGLIAAVLMSWLAARQSAKGLQELARSASSIAAGGTRRRLSARRVDEISGIAGSFNEIAEQLERTVQTLAAERNRFEAVLESMSDAVIALDDQHRVTLVNEEALRLLGLRESPVGRTLLETLRAPDIQELVEGAREGASRSAEFLVESPRSLRLMARAAPLRKTGGVVVVMHDVTELRRLETVRRDFVANVSHELRTPISVISANAETLLDSALEDPLQARKFADAILRNAKRLTILISDLLDISRLESGTYQPVSETLLLAGMIEKAVASVNGIAAARRQAIAVEIPQHLSAHGDPSGLDQILHNLLENAVRYGREGGRIVVRGIGEEHEVRIEVEDDGPGVEPRHRERLYERFYRVDAGRSREKGGTGLGLAIVKHLAESMGGRVGYRPAAPHGSVFWFTVPFSLTTRSRGPTGSVPGPTPAGLPQRYSPHGPGGSRRGGS